LTAKPLDQLLNETNSSTDYYVTHLAEVDKTNSIVATEEIKTEQNVLLVKKGARITADIAQRILKHKLIKPIEQQVQIENGLDGKSLFLQFERILETYPDLKQLYENNGYKQAFIKLVKSYILSPLLSQKLTVFSQQMPAHFDKTLVCTLLALNIAYKASLYNDAFITTYLAGLSHDLGFLHISPEIFSNQEQLSAQEWRAIQSHVITGYIFANIIERDYKKEVATAVLDHHERCDGSGYPMGKKEPQLSLISQIIGIADSLQAIRINQFESVGRNLRDALSFLKMNPTTYTHTVYRAAVSAIKSIPETNNLVSPFKDTADLIQHLIARGEKLTNASLIIQLLLQLTNDLDLRKDGEAMLHVIAPFDKMIKESGLVEEHILIWLEHVKNTDGYDPVNELCELELMQNELYWQLKKARNTYVNFLEREPNAGSVDMMLHLKTISTELNGFL
jgi:HD-GYP domain-containing protein (c-di-GMP phosphodiesterase class II)